MKVGHVGGTHEVNIGDRFTWDTGDSWEIVRVAGSMYSPSSIGPSPNFACRCLDDQMPTYLERYREEDGTVVFCGDSIAGCMARAANNT